MSDGSSSLQRHEDASDADSAEPRSSLQRSSPAVLESSPLDALKMVL
jgi:hypothetical protein